MSKKKTVSIDGAALREWRGKQKITAAQLGEKVGLSAKHINNIEAGISVPSVVAYKAIIAALNVPDGTFLLPDKEPEQPEQMQLLEAEPPEELQKMVYELQEIRCGAEYDTKRICAYLDSIESMIGKMLEIWGS